MFVEPRGLVRGHLPADIEKHVDIGFFEIAPSDNHLIDLGVDLGFIEHVRTRNFLQLRFFMLKPFE